MPGACGPGVAARVLGAFRVLLVRLRLLYLCWATECFSRVLFLGAMGHLTHPNRKGGQGGS